MNERPLIVAWITATSLLILGLVIDRAHHLPDRISGAMAVGFAAFVMMALWVRLGGRGRIAFGISLVYGGIAVALQNSLMLRGSAFLTLTATAIAAIALTVPAPRISNAVGEVVRAYLIALCGAFAAAGFHVSVDKESFRYLTILIAFGGAIAMVYGPGAGLQGLGRRGYALFGSVAVLFLFAIGYSLALTHWGTHYFADSINNIRSGIYRNLNAAPHMIEVVIGVPSLMWGVFTRARRRQGWWMCAFGVAMTTPTAAALILGAATKVALLGGLYSLILGGLLGIIVIRLEQIFFGPRGRRSNRAEDDAVMHRPEPPRWDALR